MKAIHYFPSCKYIVEKYILRTHQDTDDNIPNRKEIDNEKEIDNKIANNDNKKKNQVLERKNRINKI